MEFDTPENLAALRRTSRDFAFNELRSAEVAIDRDADPAEAFAGDAFGKVMAGLYGMGIHKLTLPVDRGGLGAPAIADHVAREELAVGGAGITATMLVATIAPTLIVTLGLEDRHPIYKEYIERFVEDTTGHHSSAWAITEPDIGSDIFTFDRAGVHLATKAVHDSGVTATSEGGGYKIHGAKSAFVSNGYRADFLLVMAAVEPRFGMVGTGAFLVPGDLPGLRRGRPLDKLGLRALNQAELHFDDVWVPEEMLIVPPGDAYHALLDQIVTLGNTAVGTIALGVARAAYTEALAYSKQRLQGGRPIFEHQNVSLKLFDAFRWIEASRALLWKAARLNAEDRPDLPTAMAARTVACDTAVRVTSDAIQVFGGYGISKDNLAEKLYRDAKVLCLMDGTVERVSLYAASQL